MSDKRDAATREYMTEQQQKVSRGVNPWRVFEAGWDAAKADDEVRSSGWSGVRA